MGHPKENSELTFTYRDYLKWPDNERWELIYGKAYDMSPSPSRYHHEIVGELYRQFANFLIDKHCRVFISPLDVRLYELDSTDDKIQNVVQPDIIVVCDDKKLDEKGCIGPPDLIIEVTSPYTASKDHIKKLFLYEKSGVKEYWIIQPIDNIIMVRILDNNHKYGIPKVYNMEDKIKVGIFNELSIDMSILFSSYLLTTT